MRFAHLLGWPTLQRMCAAHLALQHPFLHTRPQRWHRTRKRAPGDHRR